MKVYRIGYLSPAAGPNPGDQAFERSLKGLGYKRFSDVAPPPDPRPGTLEPAGTALPTHLEGDAGKVIAGSRKARNNIACASCTGPTDEATAAG